MKRLMLLGLLVMCIICTGSVTAQTLDSYDVDFTIAFNRVVVDTKMVYEDPFTGQLLIDSPKDATGSSVYVDTVLTNKSIKEGNLDLILDSAESVRFNYVTRELLDGSSFLVNLVYPYDSEKVVITLTLPDDAVLSKPISKATLSSGAVFPTPTEMTTDGISIIIKWEIDNVSKGEEFSAYVKYEKKDSNLILLLILMSVVIIGLIVFIVFRKTKVETIVKTKVVKKHRNIEEHLKEDEEQVVNILKQRENQCEQGTLRVITGFSKAKLSGLLKELEERKIIHKEKRGKKNLVFLKDQ